MNLPLLCVVLPLAGILFIVAVRWIHSVYYRSARERDIVWGGFKSDGLVAAWCVTYVLSSLGGLLTFYVHVVFKGDDLFPAFLFAGVNITYIVFLLVVDKHGYSRVYVVQVCLIVNTVLYLMIFLYTWLKFPLDDKDVSNATLLGVTHFCNAVAIFHAMAMDGFLWFGEWRRLVEEVESLE
jgi:hypothetical protein